MEAWWRAEYSRVRADRVHRTGNNNAYPMSEDEDISPIASDFTEMNPSVAAALLIGMTPEETAWRWRTCRPRRAERGQRDGEMLAGKVTEADVDRLAGAVGDGPVVAMNAERR